MMIHLSPDDVRNAIQEYVSERFNTGRNDVKVLRITSVRDGSHLATADVSLTVDKKK